MNLDILPLAITMMAGPQILSAIIFLTTPKPLKVSAAFVPALADQGGNVHEGSCGLGYGGAHWGIADPTAPGASDPENARFPPSEAGCTGQG